VLVGPRPPRRLDRLVCANPDLAGTVPILTEGPTPKITDPVEGIVTFPGCSTDHHDIAVVEPPLPLPQHHS
jgi:hypothetical protein